MSDLSGARLYFLLVMSMSMKGPSTETMLTYKSLFFLVVTHKPANIQHASCPVPIPVSETASKS